MGVWQQCGPDTHCSSGSWLLLAAYTYLNDHRHMWGAPHCRHATELPTGACTSICGMVACVASTGGVGFTHASRLRRCLPTTTRVPMLTPALHTPQDAPSRRCV
jgi:hypothetical protein